MQNAIITTLLLAPTTLIFVDPAGALILLAVHFVLHGAR